jgi:hypothetical protein
MQKTGPVFARQIESIPGPLGTYIQRLRTKPRVVGRTGRGREIEQVVDLSQIERLADVLFDQGESGLIDQSGEVGDSAGGKVVYTYEVMALGEEGIAKMRAKEAGGAGDQDTISRQNTVSPRFEVNHSPQGLKPGNISSSYGPTKVVP